MKDEEELLLFGRLGLEAEMHCETVLSGVEGRRGEGGRVSKVGDWRWRRGSERGWGGVSL